MTYLRVLRIYFGLYHRVQLYLQILPSSIQSFLISDLPQSFLSTMVQGAGSEQSYPAGMELVWDLEADNYRVFNWNSVESDPKEFSIDESYFT